MNCKVCGSDTNNSSCVCVKCSAIDGTAKISESGKKGWLHLGRWQKEREVFEEIDTMIAQARMVKDNDCVHIMTLFKSRLEKKKEPEREKFNV